MKASFYIVLLLGLYCYTCAAQDCGDGIWDTATEDCDISAQAWIDTQSVSDIYNPAAYPCCDSGTCKYKTVANGYLSTICRTAVGGCDIPETCDGTSGLCPADALQLAGASCGGTPVGSCDVADTCDGVSPVCEDAIRPVGYIVANITSNPLYICANSEVFCNGSKDAVTLYKPSTVLCKADTTCQFASYCSGSDALCPAATNKPTTTLCRNSTGVCDPDDYCRSGSCPNVLYNSTVVCRAAAGACDSAEFCTGSAAACPADTKRAASFVCRSADGACDVAESCDGSSDTCPSDSVQPSSFTCRSSTGDCDPAETCDGSSTDCPSDVISANGTVCRSATGDCDITETCDGIMGTCPTDSFQDTGYVCRAAAGACDVAETCAGGTADCPADSFVSASVECRAAAGECDAAESCTGSSASCPADAKQPSSTVCRLGDISSACNSIEYCTGNSDTCPDDTHAPASTVCRDVVAGEDCDVAEMCTGTSSTCPTDALKPEGTECRAQNGQCDAAETCTGSSKTCPADVYQSGTQCRAQNDVCDVAETCPGDSPNCPADAYAASNVECRAAAGECDVAETCTGSSASCPADAKQSTSFVCRAGNAALPCNLPETCDGTSNTCPLDSHMSGGVCRTASGACDVEESCDGTSASCPTDSVQGSSYVCRAKNGDCDVAENCDGSSKTCPADGYDTGSVCRGASGECDSTETCSGSSPSCPADATDASLCAAGYTCDSATNKNCWAYCVDSSVYVNATDCGEGEFINCPSSNPILISGVCHTVAEYKNNYAGFGFEVAIPVAQNNDLDYCDGPKVYIPTNSAPPTNGSTTTASLYVRCLDAGLFSGSIVTDNVFQLSILNSVSMFNSPVTLFFPKWKPVITVWDLMNKCLAYLNTAENRWMCVDYALAINGNYVTGVTVHNSEYAIVDVCDGNGEMAVSNTMCSCYSGYTWQNVDRLDCTVVADSSCMRVLTERLNTSVEESSVVDSLTFSGNQMHLAISGTIGANRTTTTIKFADATNDLCHYPSARWNKRVDTCRDTFNLDLDWQYNVECGFIRNDTDATYLTYTAEIHVTALDLVGKLHGIAAVRNITNILNIELRFLKKIDVTTTIEVFGQIPVQAGISEQRYDPNTGRAYLSIRTRALFPFKMMSPSVTLPGDFDLVSTTEVATDCPSTWGSRCDQTWQVVFTPDTSSCNLNGQYAIDFMAGCTNMTVCPVDADSIDSTTIVATVVSENFCGERVNDVYITGSLKSYQDAALSVPIMGFLQNRTAYFQASVSSQNITIMSAQVTDLTVYDDETVSAILYSASSNTAAGTMYSFATTPGSNTASFQFMLHPDLVPVPHLKHKWFNIRATVKVGFQNEKREIQEVVQEFDFMDGYTSTRVIGGMDVESIAVASRDEELPIPQPGGMSATSKGLIAGITVAGSLTVVVVGALFLLYRKKSTVAYSTVN